jgi:nitrogen regulatory protein PII-like uncharacterized protein
MNDKSFLLIAKYTTNPDHLEKLSAHPDGDIAFEAVSRDSRKCLEIGLLHPDSKVKTLAKTLLADLE